MATYLKIIKKSALSWWFEVDNFASSLRSISDFECNIGDTFNIVEIDGSKIFVKEIGNITLIDETVFPYATYPTTINPVVLEQRLRTLDFVPFRGQTSTPSGSSYNFGKWSLVRHAAGNTGSDILLNDLAHGQIDTDNYCLLGRYENYTSDGNTNNPLNYEILSTGDNTGDNAVNTLYSGLEASKQNTLVAGTNITIDNTNPLLPVISASGGGGSASVLTTYKTATSSNLPTQDVTGFLAYVNGVGSFSIAANEIVKYTITDTQQIFEIKAIGTARSVGSGQVALVSTDILEISGIKIEPLKTFTSSLSQSFGDSTTVGQGATAGQGWNTLLTNLYGVTNTQRAVGGTGVFQTIKNHNQFVNPFHNNLCTVMSGFNDVRRGGNAAKTLAKISNAYRGVICNHFLNRFVDANTVVSSIVRSGTWTAYNASTVGGKTSGRFSSASGNFNEYTFKDTNVVLAMIGGDGVAEIHGTFTVHIDGVLQGSYSLNNQTDGISDGINSNTRSPFILFFKNLTDTQHVLKVTHTDNNTLPIDYFGHLSKEKFTSALLIMDAPYMNATGYATAPANATTPIINQLNALIDTVVSEFSAAYPIYRGKTNNYYDIATGLGADNIHPNNIGYRQIYLAAAIALEKITMTRVPIESILGLANTFTGINTFNEQTKMIKGLQIQGTFSPAPVGEGLEYEYLSNQAYISALNRTGTSWRPINFRGSVLNFLISNVLKLTIKSTGVFNIVLPVYANDTTAGVGGLVSGDMYKTETGEIKIKI